MFVFVRIVFDVENDGDDEHGDGSGNGDERLHSTN